jgi:hypothetical protein
MNKQRNMLFAGSVFWFAFVYWFAARGVSSVDRLSHLLLWRQPLPHRLLFLAGVRIIHGFHRTVVSISSIFLIALNGWRIHR